MAKVIVLSNSKGGCGKTTTTAALSYAMGLYGYKVLSVDMDPQGHLSMMVSGKKPGEFKGKTIYHAMEQQNPKPYIVPITDTLHLLPANNYLATLGHYLDGYKGNRNFLLRDTLSHVRELYDYILIDTPPTLGDFTLNSLAASDFSIAITQPTPFSQASLVGDEDNAGYMDTVEEVRKRLNPGLSTLGILISMMDSIAVQDEEIYQQIKKKYSGLVFDTIIKKRARVQAFSSIGIQAETSKDKQVLLPYAAFTKEVVQRVRKKERQPV